MALLANLSFAALSASIYTLLAPDERKKNTNIFIHLTIQYKCVCEKTEIIKGYL